MNHEEPPVSPTQDELAKFLRDLRASRKLSLREAEDASGVSNAYLSQLEQGKISKPSPQTLHKLASAYTVPYEALMEKAGYISRDMSGHSEQRSGVLAPTALGKLSRSEEAELLSYLGYIRSKQKHETK